MTFSIVASDGADVGVAVASKFIAVGAVVPHAKAGVGAVATQCYANPRLGEVVLGHLAAGADAESALRRALEGDPGREEGRIGVVDVKRRAASHTGARCPEYAGHVVGDGFAAQVLAGPTRRDGRMWRSVYGEGSEAVREGVDKGSWSSS